MERQKYTPAERKAYYMGLGASKAGGRAHLIQRLLKRMPPIVKQSFLNGFDDGLKRK